MTNALPKIFISYSHRDNTVYKDRLLKHLNISADRLSFWDDRQIALGQDWLTEIEAALSSAAAAILLVSPDFLNSKFIQSQEVPPLLQRRSAEGLQIFPIIVRACNWQQVDWLSRMQAYPTDDKTLADFRGNNLDKALAAFVAKIDSLLNQSTNTASPSQPESIPDNSSSPELPPEQKVIQPYLGLSAFREQDAALFFGRDSFVQDVHEKTLKHPLVAVVGPSGSGKSSVVQAGLLPRLRESKKPLWAAAIFTPGDAPFRKLAEALVRIEEPHADRLKQRRIANQRAKDLASGEVSILDAVEIALEAQRSADKLLLIADQFEELFTQTLESDRKPFAAQLIAAARSGKATVVLTLRADFYGQAISLSTELSKLIEQGVVNHRPLDEADLRQVIVKPAQRAGLQFDAELVEEILTEVAAQPDSLPLLEYALTEMWRRRRHNAIGQDQYKAIGKIAGAINQRADEVLAHLPAEQQEPALRALTRLVRVSISEEDGAATRLRLPLADFSAAEQKLLEEFVKARLLVTDRNPLTNEETIEVAHEALIRRWEKLRAALDKDRDFLSWRRRLEFRMEEWERSGRDEGALLRGAILEEAKQWLELRGSDLGASEKLFIVWTERPDYQVERILAKAPHLIFLSGNDAQHNWFVALALCLGSQEAITAIRLLDNPDAQHSMFSKVAKTVNRAGKLNVALSIIRKIEHTYSRSRALCDIAQDTAKSIDRVSDAISITKKIKDASNRGSALRAIAQALSDAGKFDNALTIARKIDNTYVRVMALIAVAEAFNNVGQFADAKLVLKEAMALARSTYEIHECEFAFRSLARAFSTMRRFNNALTVSRAISDAADRAFALNDVAAAFINVGRFDDAKLIIDEALTLVPKIDSFRGGIVSQQIVQLRCKLGLFDEALALAHTTDNMFFPEQPLCEVVQAVCNAGRLDKALAIIHSMDDINHRKPAFSGIAQALSNASRLNDALADLLKITPTDKHKDLLRDTAAALGKGGKFGDARAVAHMIDDAPAYALTLKDIAQALIEAGKLDDAKLVLDEALKGPVNKSKSKRPDDETRKQRRGRRRRFASEDEYAGFDDSNPAEVLSAIAQTYADAGKFDDALTVAHTIDNYYVRATALCNICISLFDAKLMETAFTLATEIQAAIVKIFDERERSEVAVKLTQILSRLRNYSEAREVADHYALSSQRLAAYTAILREYHIERNPDLADVFAKLEQNEYESLELEF